MVGEQEVGAPKRVASPVDMALAADPKRARMSLEQAVNEVLSAPVGDPADELEVLSRAHEIVRQALS